MKNVVFFFSGTGNSLYAAKKIAACLDDSEVVAMNEKNLAVCLEKVETVGFVFPVYAQDIPEPVYNFIKKIKLKNVSYTYAVATCGFRIASGRSLYTVDCLLREKGLRLSYGRSVKSVPNFILFYNMPENTECILHKFSRNINVICQQIVNRNHSLYYLHYPLFKLTHKAIMSMLKRRQSNFWVSDGCIGCGLCVKTCPVSNITVNSHGKVTFLGHCELCMACIQYCPRKAIQYKSVTKDRRRYHHPDIAAVNLQNVDK